MSKYDIYVADLNLIIECQSWFHDRKNDYDIRKRQFAVDSGYQFLSLDCRDYSPLQVIQYFDPSINELPEYINFNYYNKVDLVEAQKMYDDGVKIQEIADRFNVKYHTIIKYICDNKIIKRNDFSARDSYELHSR